jgi:PAS domain S-box-containing protein
MSRDISPDALLQRVRELEAAVADGMRLEAALRQREADFEEAQRVSRIGSWTFDAATGRVRWSKELYRMFGVAESAGPMTFERFLSCVDPEDRARVRATNRVTMESGQPFEMAYRIVLPEGTVKHVREIGYARQDADGRVLGLFGTAQDITEQLRMESALLESEAKFRALFENTGVGIAVGDPRSGRMDLVNPAFAAMLGYQQHELVGMSLSAFSHPQDFAEELAYMRELVEGRRDGYDMEKRYRRKDGSEFWGRLNVSVVRNKGGDLVFGIGMIQDIDERRRAEELLGRRSRQLAELASELTLAEQRVRRRLADDLHDRLQQLLVGARLLAHALASCEGQKKADLSETLERTLGEALEATRSMTMDLAPPVAMHRDLPDAIRWLEEDMRRLHGLAVSSRIEPGMDNVSEAEGVLLFTAARELLLNVVKHAGTLKAVLRLRRKADALVLEVCDAGRGFDSPAWSAAQSQGFGIFSIRERVELHGGSFELKVCAGGGVRAVLVLPSSAGSATRAPQPDAPVPVLLAPTDTVVRGEEQPASSAPSRIRVLFADDHRIVRESLVSLLAAQSDIEVVGESGNGREAVENTGKLRPDVVVMDVCMPVLDGVDATRQIKASWPSVKVVGLSMYEEPAGGDKMRGAGADAFVCKTAPPVLLIDAIRRCARG